MKFTGINAIFTAKVAEYIAKGYTISTHSMAGHQGEIGKVDLTNGSEIIRINLENNHSWDDNLWADRIILTVGRCTNPDTVKAAETREVTLWTDRLEQVEAPRIFWKMNRRRNNDWYVEGEAGKECIRKSYSRWKAETNPHPDKNYAGDGFDQVAKIVLPAVRRHLGKPKMKVDRLASIERRWSESLNCFEYTVVTVGRNLVRLH